MKKYKYATKSASLDILNFHFPILPWPKDNDMTERSDKQCTSNNTGHWEDIKCKIYL